jgi:predicted PurR-regulated permease PerM
MKTQTDDKTKLAIDIAIKLGLMTIVLYIAYLIAQPFIAIVVWGIIIAVALNPSVSKLENFYDNRKVIVVSLTIIIISLLVVPTYMLSDKLYETSSEIIVSFKDGNLTIPPPTSEVKEWPIIGERAYSFWESASQNIQHTLAPFNNEIKKLTGTAFGILKSGMATIFMFIGSMIIAAFFLMSSESAVKFYHKLSSRLLGDRGPEWANLSALTIRSVVTGVIGVAVIQATLALLGMAVMKIPFAIVWAILVMFLTIVQIPASLVIFPVIAYVFSHGTGTPQMVFAIYMVIVSISDGVLKPVLMGRGVDIPMLVILIGAIGGMILMGMIGLFIGAVIFALAYKLFTVWIDDVSTKD